MRRFVVVFACLMALTVPAATQTADIVGTWELSVVSDQGNMSTASLVLKKEETVSLGTLTAPQGDMPVQATLKDVDERDRQFGDVAEGTFTAKKKD